MPEVTRIRAGEPSPSVPRVEAIYRFPPGTKVSSWLSPVFRDCIVLCFTHGDSATVLVEFPRELAPRSARLMDAAADIAAELEGQLSLDDLAA